MEQTTLAYLAALAVLAAVLAVLISRRRENRIMNQLDRMLDDAINGNFQESNFTESAFSALEAKMHRYLGESEISARRTAEEKNRIKELISDISHQTKTPLANILVYTELLQEQELNEISRDYVQALHQQSDKLQFLINSLMKISRLETGILQMHKEKQEVSEILYAAVKQAAQKAKAKRIRLEVAAGKQYAVFDRKWTLEAIQNLVDNAVKYTQCCGKVTLDVVSYELFCRISVRDTGIGIAEEEQAKIFRRFYRSPSVSQEEGVGIGLYFTREILAAQGGYIKVASAPREGSTFLVYLPR